MASPYQLKSLAALREAFPELKAEAELNKAYAAAYDKAMVGVPLKERPTLEQWKATTIQTAPSARFQGALPMEHTRSSGQDASTQPVDSQWRAALRAYLAGTAGLPGDLEGLARQGINAAFGLGGVKVDETPVLPTTEFYKDWLPGKQEGAAPLADLASMLGGAGSTLGVRSLGSLGKAVAHAAPGPVAGGKLAQLGVIRNTGDNNFLKGSVENALSGLKGSIREYRPPAFPDLPAPGIEEALAGQNARAASVNKFVEGPLTRYVKNQMATPDDPVRALAEQGVLHVDPQSLMRQHATVHPSGEVLAKLGQTPMAKSWENAADQTLYPEQVRTFMKSVGNDGTTTLSRNPWLADRPLDQTVMDFTSMADVPRDLGFTHLTDELRNALNPESGLPRNLLLTPEKLQNMGMERAVRHVAAINDWRAAQVAEANAQKANNAATVLHKEYPHTPETPNPKGLRWVELKAPETLPEGYRLEGNNMLSPEGESLGTVRPDYTDEAMEDVLHRYAREHSLTNALKYEGDTMKHCVGGYCDDVISGQKRIFSLRDAKGEPHVTIHTEPGVASDSYLKSLPDPDHLTGGDMLVPDSSWSLYDYVHRHRKGNGDFDSYANKALAEHGYELPPEKIVQIKRKANLVNSDPYEYRPFVQDFVKSGKWSDVGDLANTGLVKINGGSTNIYDGPNKYKGLTVPDAGYYTPRELADHFETQGVPRLAARQHAGDIDGLTEALTPPEGFSTGGRVSMIHPAAAIQPLVRVPGFDRF